MIKRIFVVLFSLLATPALAQWQTPSHAVPVGKGAGVTGFSNAAPGAAGQVLTSNGASADPTFQSIGNTLNAQSAPYTIQASDNNKTVYVTGNPGVVTLPTVTGGGFVANAQVRVCNGNANTAATHAFGLSGFPNPVFARLYQQQCVW